MTTKKTSKNTARPVVVTTSHRGVFVGMTDQPSDAETITLTRARMVVYWPTETRSVLGLATRGAPKGSRVSDAADRIVLRNITAVIDATPEALASWESAPWA